MTVQNKKREHRKERKREEKRRENIVKIERGEKKEERGTHD